MASKKNYETVSYGSTSIKLPHSFIVEVSKLLASRFGGSMYDPFWLMNGLCSDATTLSSITLGIQDMHENGHTDSEIVTDYVGDEIGIFLALSLLIDFLSPIFDQLDTAARNSVYKTFSKKRKFPGV